MLIFSPTRWAVLFAGGDIRVRQRFNNNVRLPGYGGGTTDTTAVATYLDGRNTEVSASTASHGGGTGTFTGGAACTQPSPLANFDETASAGSKVSNWNNDLTTSQIDVAMASIEINPTDVDWGSNGAVMASANIDIAPTKIETPSANVEWASANIEIEPTAVETTTAAVDNGPSTFGAIASLVDKMTSQISPTVYSQETTKQVPEAGLVTVNGSGSGFTLPTNKSTTITFRAAISNPTTPVNTFSVSNQGSVSATGFGPVLTDDPGVAGVANPTVTTVVQPPTIAKTFTPANILLDQQSTLTITINNTNPAQAVTGITVTDVFPTNVVVATPLVASTTCGAGTLQDSDGNTLAPGDVGIKLITGTRAAAQSCTVTVKVRGTSGGTYVNTTGNVASFEGFVGTTASSTLNVSVLTATELSISGRVTSSEGRGIRNARVVITGNSLAQPINVFTGVNGTYQVNGLAAGETYIVTVMSRRFAFESPSRVVTLIDNVTDADFIGLLGTDRQQ
ncbi:MAG: carboxypeptidase regulatory-like domain-containing protein [Chloracidobacterium sp.]|nr:carboxypeptidase regulatory-like domain-containing protein [Chloracidobacterium sp.]